LIDKKKHPSYIQFKCLELKMKLSDYIPADHVIHSLVGSTKIEIIEELLGRMRDLKLVDQYELALNDILDREGYLSTGLENGLAIPHAKTDSIGKLEIVFGLKKEGAAFESLDGKPAENIFLVLSPKDTSGPHIQALALITRNLKDAQVREKIKDSDSAETIAKIFQEFE
jgi:mannitol/fructose-specific phosphotransferase system IIA component (Ntr-type)